MKCSFAWLALVLGIALASFPRGAHAGCTTGTLRFAPLPGEALPVDGRIVLQGSGVYRSPVERVAARAPKLVSTKGNVVALRVAATYDAGSFATVVLAPTTDLRSETYSLVLDASSTDDPLHAALTVDNGRGPAPIAWRAAPAGSPPGSPWTRAPRLLRHVASQFCPYPSFAEVDVPAAVSRRVLAVELHVTELSSASVRRYLVLPDTVSPRARWSP